MAFVNDNFRKLAAGYLFPEIGRRTREYAAAHEGVKIYRLGIGDVTEPLPRVIVNGIKDFAESLATADGFGKYGGYGPEAGRADLRQAISDRFYQGKITPEEIFISDGAKSDTANIQMLFSEDNTVAVQDPAYPVYVDTNVATGRTLSFNQETKQYGGLVYMPCTAENGFLPKLPSEDVDLIYLCSPNNPTGAVMTGSKLEEFVSFSKLTAGANIIFDAAYTPFISDPSLPRSIYEIPGAKEVAIEVNSFSKFAGLTGVRLGWTVVPKDFMTLDSEKEEVGKMWNRRQSTFFNGASALSQAAGLAALTDEGYEACMQRVAFYKENARLIKSGLEKIGLKVYGADNAPYVWMKTPNGMPSWDFFNKLLSEAKVVGTPGSGFGPSGEGYFRLSAFGHREDVEAALNSIQTNLRL